MGDRNNADTKAVSAGHRVKTEQEITPPAVKATGQAKNDTGGHGGIDTYCTYQNPPTR
jgi:hypothetical protein